MNQITVTRPSVDQPYDCSHMQVDIDGDTLHLGPLQVQPIPAYFKEAIKRVITEEVPKVSGYKSHTFDALKEIKI